jgi:putative hemolysin
VSVLNTLPMALGGLALTGIFASLHMALLYSARTTLGEIAASRPNKRAQKRIAMILADVEGHALAQGMISMVCALLTALGMIVYVSALSEPGSITRLDVVVGVLIAMPLLWMVGVILPSSLGEHTGERLVYSSSSLIRISHGLCWPLIAVALSVDEIVRRLVASKTTDAQSIEADLLSVVEEGQQEGQFDAQERDMIAAVVRFRTITAEEIMTPRTDIDALPYTDDLSKVKDYIRTVGHSRIPVYEENLDHIVGILYAKDLLRWLAEHDDRSTPFVLRRILRPAPFVPETKTVRDLMADLLERKTHMTLIADEYGGTAGLATMEDIVEEIFGDIQDEYESHEDESPSVDVDLEAGLADIDARAHIDDVNDELAPLRVSLPESDDYDTVGGFVIVTLGRIPQTGEQLQHQRLLLTVTDAEPTRVNRVRLQLVPNRDEEPEPVVAES